MYEFPFGAGQQLNLNWIINEIITIHKQLDPDYELPNFDTAFPYMNLNTLNLDWILRELKAIKDLAPTEDATLLKMVANALLAETYDATTQYNVDDIVYRDNEKRLFKCITTTPAGGEAWDSSKWVEIDVGEVLTDLLVNGGTANAVTNVRYNNHKIQQEINGTYSDVITIEDAPTDVSDRLPSSKAVYNLNGAITYNEKSICAYIQDTNIADRQYGAGDYLIYNHQLYIVTGLVNQGDTLNSSNMRTDSVTASITAGRLKRINCGNFNSTDATLTYNTGCPAPYYCPVAYEINGLIYLQYSNITAVSLNTNGVFSITRTAPTLHAGQNVRVWLKQN